ncbi:MAG: response regulator [Gammaproteobacteria bacterium]|jgi:PAS domain S-box-containing protein|nr:response regulator [Gammaproteobacteria bacterium]MBT4607071.1 response regulator [Thiotrichales bacterium]MBT3966976.1 response regulator [Gammaproteobacteria bacterium]MBT4081336.1 response regulator [Gammaproteobacteria bacterium]MBT4328724.1 response regulator [Gammaproteobacteria bacterium]
MDSVRNMKILLVDDSHAMAGLYQEMLESHGYQVVVAYNGADALELAQREQPDIGLLDFHLPDFTGDELTRRLLADPLTQGMVISMLSSYSDVTRSSLDAGAIDMITKDTPEELFLLRIESLERKVLIEREALLERDRGGEAKITHLQDELIPFKVLIVDDSKFVRSAYQAMLLESGCKVVVAESMKQALEMARTERPDLAIVDFYMKGGNGDELTRALLEDPITRNVLVVVLTSQMEVKDIALAAGAVDVINKGEHQSSFIQRIASIREYRQQVARQIRSHMRSDQEAERLHQWVNSILKSIQAPIIVVDGKGGIIHTNPAAEALIGVQIDELLGEELNMLFVDERGEEASPLSLTEDRTLRCAGGETVPVHVSGALLSHSQDNETLVEGAVLVLHDLSQRLRDQQQQQYLAFQSGVAEMSASILHNIGNTLSGLGGYVVAIEKKVEELKQLQEIMLRVSDSDEANEVAVRKALKVSASALNSMTDKEGIGQSLKKIDESIRRIDRTISIHRSASMSDLSASCFPLSELIEDALVLTKECIDSSGIELVTVFNLPVDHHVEMQRNPAIQMVLNLLKNSIEAIKYRGQSVEDEVWRPEIRISLLNKGNGAVQLTIEDNGCGITPEQQPHLFTQGYTTKVGGSGFGLHSVGGFIQGIGGELELQSQGTNQGAMAKITL